MSYAFVQTDWFLGCAQDFQQRDGRYLAELWETVSEISSAEEGT